MVTLLLPYNAPYLTALILLLIIGGIELLALLTGMTILSHFDTALGNLSAGDALLGQGLDWLHIGRLPLLVLLVIFLGGFSITGLTGQHLSIWVMGEPASSMVMNTLATLVSISLVHYCGKVIIHYFPSCESEALSETSFIGQIAVITGPASQNGVPTTCRFTDKFGQIHYLLVEPEAGKELKHNERVLIIDQLSDSLFLAEKNPWPDHL